MPYTLGIDQGTTQTTALIVDEHGAPVAQRSVALPVRFPRRGRVEQDPWDIIRTVREATLPLLDTYPIEAVGFDNQGETFILWDAETGEPATPAIVWQDKRGSAVCDALAQDVDAAWLRQKTGLLLDSYFSAPKLKFVLDHDADLRRAAHAGRLRFGTTESWVLWHLSGGRLHVTDPSTASRTLLFDINTLTWDDDLLDLFDVPAGILPDVYPSAGYVGDIDFGNGEPLPLHALLVDQQAALFGQACFAPGEMKCTFGTGSFLLMNVGDRPQLSDHGLITTVAWDLPAGTSYALDGGVFVTGAAVQWLHEGLGLLNSVAESAAVATTADTTDSDVVCVPALAGLGAPHWRPEVQGAMFGLTRGTQPADIVRALLDGIAFQVRDVVRAMEQDAGTVLTHLRVDGGPSGNDYLMQVLADLLGIEVHVTAAQEATALGAANAAAHSALDVPLAELVDRWHAGTVYTPHMTTEERRRRDTQWQSAVAALEHFHNDTA